MAKKKTTKAKKTATRKSSKSKKAAAPLEVLLVGTKVKAAIKEAGCNTAGDALEGLNHWMHWLIQQATARAVANGRKTVRAHDFISPC